MTANQIAAAANDISNKIADINAGNLEETKRHNRETERLQDEVNRITETYHEYERQWHTEQNAIQAEYNEWYKAYQESIGKAKDEAKAALDHSQERLNDANAYYRILLGETERDLLAAQTKLANAEANYKDVSLELEKRKTNVAELNAYYNAYNVENTIRLGFAQFNMDNYIKSANLDLQAKKIRNDFTLGMTQANTAAQRYSLDREQFEYFKEANLKAIQSRTKLQDTQKLYTHLEFWDPSKGLETLGRMIPFSFRVNLGGSYGSNSKQKAYSLFN